jgi:signal transduction histidine kinase/DNA-binding response OmpR family regulator
MSYVQILFVGFIIFLGSVFSEIKGNNIVLLEKSTQNTLEHINFLIRNGEKEKSYNLLYELSSNQAINEHIPLFFAIKIQEIFWHLYYEEKDSSLLMVDQAIHIAQKQNVNDPLPRLFFLKGKIANQHLDQELSVKSFEQAIHWAKKLENKTDIITYTAHLKDALEIYHFHSTRGFNPENVLPAMEKALANHRNNKDTLAFLQLFPRYIEIFRNSNSLESTKSLLDELEEILNHFTDKKTQILFFSKKAAYYSIRKNHEKEEAALRKALLLSRKLELTKLERHYYTRLKNVYLKRKQYDQALAFLDTAYMVHSPEDNFVYGFYAYSQIYKSAGNTTKALDYLERWREAHLEDLKKNRLKKLTEWETKFNIQDKENLIQIQKNQNRILWITIIFSFISIFFIAKGFFNQLKAKKKLARQKEIISKQAATLKQLDKIKSRFFANVSHELRTPLSLILGPLSSLLKGGNLNQKDKVLAQLGQKNAKNLLFLVNEILDLAKMESGKSTLQEETIELIPLLHRLKGAFDGAAQSKNIQYESNFSLSKNLWINLDVKKFEKLVNNLLSNAFKFTPSGGFIKFDVQEAHDHLLLKIEDSGRGVHPEDMPHIFNRFYQSSQTQLFSENGTGIGLSLSKELAKLMNGNLWVNSIFGQGSTFFYKFPKNISLEAEIKPIINQQVPFIRPFGPVNKLEMLPSFLKKQSTTILLVEDNESLSAFIQLIIGDKYQLVTAENGKIAWELLNNINNPLAIPSPSKLNQFPDLIISDIMMPQMNGYQFLQKLKEKEAFRAIPVIMLTALSDLKDKLKALRIGVDDYMTKPFEEEELLARIENLLLHSFWRSQYQDEIMVDSLSENNKENTLKSLPIKPAKMTLADQQWLQKLEETVLSCAGIAQYSTNQLANDLFISRQHLNRRIRQLTGMTASNYIKEARLDIARQLLEQQQFSSVKAVAFHAGFTNSKYFGQAYKQRFGKLPSTYFE